MRLPTRVRVVLILTLLIPAAGFAADVLVLAAGAMQPGLIAAEPAFRKVSGHQIKVTYAIASELRRRVGGGEVARNGAPLPEDIQNYTRYTAARITAGANPDAANAFLHYLASPAGKALFAENGIR